MREMPLRHAVRIVCYSKHVRAVRVACHACVESVPPDVVQAIESQSDNDLAQLRAAELAPQCVQRLCVSVGHLA